MIIELSPRERWAARLCLDGLMRGAQLYSTGLLLGPVQEWIEQGKKKWSMGEYLISVRTFDWLKRSGFITHVRDITLRNGEVKRIFGITRTGRQVQVS